MLARSTERVTFLDALVSESSLSDGLAVGDAGDGRGAAPSAESTSFEAHAEVVIKTVAAARAASAHQVRFTG